MTIFCHDHGKIMPWWPCFSNPGVFSWDGKSGLLVGIEVSSSFPNCFWRSFSYRNVLNLLLWNCSKPSEKKWSRNLGHWYRKITNIVTIPFCLPKLCTWQKDRTDFGLFSACWKILYICKWIRQSKTSWELWLWWIVFSIDCIFFTTIKNTYSLKRRKNSMLNDGARENTSSEILPSLISNMSSHVCKVRSSSQKYRLTSKQINIFIITAVIPHICNTQSTKDSSLQHKVCGSWAVSEKRKKLQLLNWIFSFRKKHSLKNSQKRKDAENFAF